MAMIKRKSIANLLKKLLNKPNKIQEKIKQTTPNISEALEDKLKIIPKPNFTCTKESDPKLYKKECKKYVDSILPYSQYVDDDIACSAIELIGKYGFTEKHLECLAGFAGTNETEPRIIRAFVNAIADFGRPERSGFIANFLERTRAEKNINLYDNETLKTIIKGLDRIGNVEEIEVLEKYLNHNNKEVQELAQKAIESIKSRGTYRGYKAWV